MKPFPNIKSACIDNNNLSHYYNYRGNNYEAYLNLYTYTIYFIM